MVKIKQLYSNFIVKLQEAALTFGAKKRIQIMLEHIDIRPGDIVLDVGGNTGKITEAYTRNCKEVVILEPKHNVIEYARAHRPFIKFIEGQAEDMPLPDEYFDKVIASASFHHFPNQDKGLKEMKRVLKPGGKMIIMEIDPNTRAGKRLKICESILHTGAKLYEPFQLRKKVEDHDLQVISIKRTTLAYFLTAIKSVEKNKG